MEVCKVLAGQTSRVSLLPHFIGQSQTQNSTGGEINYLLMGGAAKPQAKKQ